MTSQFQGTCSATSQDQSPVCFAASSPPTGATRDRWGHAAPTPGQRPRARDSEVRRAPGEPLQRARQGPLTCCAALSASSANSTDRPFSACLRDPHVLLFRAAQEGSGVVSEPKALRENETGGDTQGQSNRHLPLPGHHVIGATCTSPDLGPRYSSVASGKPGSLLGRRGLGPRPAAPAPPHWTPCRVQGGFGSPVPGGGRVQVKARPSSTAQGASFPKSNQSSYV